MKRKRKAAAAERAGFSAGFFDELVVDNFAGGGGASLGIERALGRAVDLAINHDREAVELHKANHPHTLHYCEDVWRVEPEEATRGRPVGLAWFSPDCKHFSRAKGSKPVEKKIRGLAWVVVKWAKRVGPRVICLENVREFRDWGPLIEKRDDAGDVMTDADGSPLWVPCPARKGQTFRRWVGRLRALGYEVQWRDLNAADFGAPTHRKRLFLVARKDGAPIVWPRPTHGPGRARPWRTAAECIDWSLPCPSIFLTKEEAKPLGVNRPLAEKTMKRIAMGLKRYVFENPTPFIVRADHGGDHFRGQPIGSPLATVTGRHGFGLAVPYVAGVGGRAGQSPATAGDAPVGTITAKNDRALVVPYLAAQFGERDGQEPRSHPIDAPIPTITPRDGGGFPLIAPTLVQYNQEKGEEVRGKPLADPINTVTSENRFGLVAAFIAKHYGGVVGHEPTRPLGTVTAVDHHSLAATALIKNNHGDKQAFAAGEPLRTVMGGANHHGLVRAFLVKYYGQGEGTKGELQSVADPLHTIVAHDRFGLVAVDGEDYEIADIGLRMLTPRELYRAQGFPESYRIDVPFAGKPLTKKAQVRMCGNSVSPPVAEAIVRANYVEAAEPLEEMAS